MGNFIIGAIAVWVLWIFFSMRSRARSYRACCVFEEAESWFGNEGINSSSVLYNLYEEPKLIKNTGASVIVGSGDRLDGTIVGFVLEVIPGLGVVEALYLKPHGIATHHRMATQIAKANGIYFIDAMQKMVYQHKAQHHS